MKLIIKGELNIITEHGFQINARFIELLMLIEQTGSLNTATQQMGISYSYAWNSLYKINCQLNSSMFETYRGGNGGGLTRLTDNGKNLIQQYNKLKLEFDQFLKKHTIDI
jgi:molybdate transport system regulatory protein